MSNLLKTLVITLSITACNGGTSGTCVDASECVADAGMDARVDAEVKDSSTDATNPSDARSGWDADNTPDATCAEISVGVTRQKTNVIVIVDQSRSMDTGFGSGTRWSVLKDSLLADTGIISEFQDVVDFGVSLYSSQHGFSGGTCPMLTEVPVALNNLQAIRDVYGPAQTIKDTPTGESIDAVLGHVPTEGKTVFILATDGEPDTCAEPDAQNGQAQSVAAVTRAFAAGVPTYIIAVANEAELSQQHVQDMANAGAGHQGAQSYRVDNDQGLRDALSQVVYGEISCDVKLKGSVQDPDPCKGTVSLDGTTIACNTSEGWQLLDPSTIRLTGSACTSFKQGGKLEATFPCTTEIVILL